MRILFWAHQFWPYIGGVEVTALQLLTALRERGHDICVVSSHGALSLPDVESHQGIEVHRFPFQEALTSRDPAKIAALVGSVGALKRSFRPDVAHVNVTEPSPFFHLQTVRFFPAPYLLAARIDLQASDASRADSLLGSLVRSASWVTANSGPIMDDLQTCFPEIRPRSSVVHEVLERPVVPTAPLPFDQPRLLCIGRLVDEKGFDVAIRALALIRARFPNMGLVVAGDGPARGALEQLVDSLGLTDRVEFLGWVIPEDVPALINTSTLVVVPSRWREAFGLVALQAAQMGRPVVASRTGGLTEVVVEGQTGLLVDKEDVPALAMAIESLLADPVATTEMGRRAKVRAETSFGWPDYVDAHERVYKRIARPPEGA